MRVIGKILKYLFGIIGLWIFVALGVVAYDIIGVRRDVKRSHESFGIGESIYGFQVPAGRWTLIGFSSGGNSDFCLKATLRNDQLTVELPDQQNSTQTLVNRQDLPAALQVHSERIRQCDTIGVTAFGNGTPHRGSFSVFYEDETVTGSEEPFFWD